MLPTGRNFFAVDVRAVPTPSAWRIGQLAAERLVEAYWQEAGAAIAKAMQGVLKVLSPADYAAWLKSKGGAGANDFE